jgi:hypothetical protein
MIFMISLDLILEVVMGGLDVGGFGLCLMPIVRVLVGSFSIQMS